MGFPLRVTPGATSVTYDTKVGNMKVYLFQVTNAVRMAQGS